MKYGETINVLRENIKSTLTPLINNDYILLDLPYYSNIGDTLIWEGTKEYLETLPYKCLYYASKDSFIYRNLPKNVVILLQGGGNFGDLYRLHSEFRKKIIELYPYNKVIILPQTAFYKDRQKLIIDAEFYSQHKNVTICAREQYTYDLLKKHFKNEILLMPDMAFYINLCKYKIQKEEDRVLYLKRIDKEFVDNNINDYMPVNIETHDWPTYGHGYRKVFWVESFFSVLKHLAKAIHVNSQYIIRLDDLKRFYFYRPFYVQLGVNFLCPYSKIYTTRLHVMILGLLLGKKLVLINNSSGKIWNYYETWLKEIDSIELFRKK